MERNDMGLKIIAGDFKDADLIMPGKNGVVVPKAKGTYSFLSMSSRETIGIASIETVTEDNKKKFVGAAGWGLVGGLALGPIGALAGILAGGNKKEVCFACELKDGRKFMASADPSTHKQFLAASYGK